jgi:hypothetical protein
LTRQNPEWTPEGDGDAAGFRRFGARAAETTAYAAFRSKTGSLECGCFFGTTSACCNDAHRSSFTPRFAEAIPVKPPRMLVAHFIALGLISSAPAVDAAQERAHSRSARPSWARAISARIRPPSFARIAAILGAGSDAIPIVSWGRIKDRYRDPDPFGGGKD